MGRVGKGLVRSASSSIDGVGRGRGCLLLYVYMTVHDFLFAFNKFFV